MAKFYSESVENTQKETTEEFKYVSDFVNVSKLFKIGITFRLKIPLNL